VPTQLTKLSRKPALAAPATDWLALWAISVGFAAVLIAALAEFAAGDWTGALFVLSGAAGLIGVILRACWSESGRDN
jgi:hypothetical protein